MTHSLYCHAAACACIICLQLRADLTIVGRMKGKHAKTLRAIFTRPTLASVVFADIEALVVGLGGEVVAGDGSRVVLRLGDAVKHAHRPHPGKQARKYQIEEIRVWLESQGVKAGVKA